MTTVTINSKWQITIPQQIRCYLGVHPGDKIEFVIDENDKVCLTLLPKIDVRELKGLLPKPKKRVSIEAMNKAIVKHLLS